MNLEGLNSPRTDCIGSSHPIKCLQMRLTIFERISILYHHFHRCLVGVFNSTYYNQSV